MAVSRRLVIIFFTFIVGLARAVVVVLVATDLPGLFLVVVAALVRPGLAEVVIICALRLVRAIAIIVGGVGRAFFLVVSLGYAAMIVVLAFFDALLIVSLRFALGGLGMPGLPHREMGLISTRGMGRQGLAGASDCLLLLAAGDH